MDNPFANLSGPQKAAVAIGGAGVVFFTIYERHKKTGTWNPFSSGNATATPASSVASTDTSSGTSGTGLGTDAGGGTGNLASIPSYGSSADLSTSSPYTLNTTYPSAQQWAQAAQSGLTSTGFDPTTVAEALGAYLAQKPLTAAQEQIVLTATGEYGTPNGANGLPLQVVTQPAVTTPPPGQGGTPPPPPPPTHGSTAKQVTGVHVQVINNNRAQITWNNTAPQYQVHLEGPGENRSATVHVASADYEGLKAGDTYDFSVIAHDPSTGHDVGKAVHATVKMPDTAPRKK
jgi:hypothetical protein